MAKLREQSEKRPQLILRVQLSVLKYSKVFLVCFLMFFSIIILILIVTYTLHNDHFGLLFFKVIFWCVVWLLVEILTFYNSLRFFLNLWISNYNTLVILHSNCPCQVLLLMLFFFYSIFIQYEGCFHFVLFH